jgi:hypothetical protein
MAELQSGIFSQADFLLAPQHLLLKSGSERGQAVAVRGGVIGDVGSRDEVCMIFLVMSSCRALSTRTTI